MVNSNKVSKKLKVHNPPPVIKLTQEQFLKCLLMGYECNNCVHYAKSIGWCSVDDYYGYEYPICEFFAYG
jgi:hypothetical protein